MLQHRSLAPWLLLVFVPALVPVAGAGARAGAAGAGKPGVKMPPDPPPEILRSEKGTIETGTLSGVPYRIDVPAAWNHSLVVFFHGYSESPTIFRPTAGISEVITTMLDRGYAVTQSGFSQPGWALAEGVPESESLRQYFIKSYGKVHETIAAGVSMGGAMVMVTMEQNPKPYAGALDICGAVGPTYEAFQRRFAWRAAFDYFFPGLMPPLVPAPLEYRESAALKEKIAAALKANPVAAAQMRNLTGLHSDADLVRDISYFTYVVTDMQHRSGGNPFDNRNTLYTGTTPGSSATDDALNDGVRRYAPDEIARRYLVAHYTPSGRVTKPMLALHTTYDPLIPGWTLARYSDEVAEAGYSENFVQQYVHRDGHCAISPKQMGVSLDELLDWIHTGHRPVAGLLK